MFVSSTVPLRTFLMKAVGCHTALSPTGSNAALVSFALIGVGAPSEPPCHLVVQLIHIWTALYGFMFNCYFDF